jgi:hypothetical protein
MRTKVAGTDCPSNPCISPCYENFSQREVAAKRGEMKIEGKELLYEKEIVPGTKFFPLAKVCSCHILTGSRFETLLLPLGIMYLLGRESKDP